MFKKIQEAEINSNDPWSDDVLNRKQVAEFLTSIVKKTETPFILSINSPWGTGKTFLIKRWMTGLSKEHPCIYYNAWEEDFSNSPFASFFSSIKQSISKFEVDEELKSKLKSNLRELVRKSGLILLRSLPFLLKTGLRYVLGEDGVVVVKGIFDKETEKETVKELGDWAESQIENHLTQKQSITEFKSLLSGTIADLTAFSNMQTPMVIFIDELDRCRPNYSIELIENIKHIFSVPNVVFILSTDSRQLVHSLKAVYGKDLDADTYLRKIIDQQINLQTPSFLKFAEILQQKIAINRENVAVFKEYEPGYVTSFGRLSELFGLSLRDQEQAYARLKAAFDYSSHGIHFSFLAFLIIVSMKYPQVYEDYRAKKVSLSGLLSNVSDLVINNEYWESLKKILFIYARYSNDEIELNERFHQLSEIRNQADKFEFMIINYFKENFHFIVKYGQLVDMTRVLI